MIHGEWPHVVFGLTERGFCRRISLKGHRMDLDSLEDEDENDELEDEWRDRITKHLPSRVSPDDWVVKAFELGTVIAVALTIEEEDETDETITVTALAKIEAGRFESEDGQESEAVWFFPDCKEWSLENAEESWEDAAIYLAGEITKALK
ncbi:MAG: hypothetical protein C0467_28970 [Planctomycetaceae bacterium]|nr:hypothetical protein [Planctomycetaceae bacterium]